MLCEEQIFLSSDFWKNTFYIIYNNRYDEYIKTGYIIKAYSNKKCITYKLYNKWKVWKVDGF